MFPSLSDTHQIRAALGGDLLVFLPELAVCAGVVALLLARLVPALDRAHLGGLAVSALAVALFAAVNQWIEGQWAGPFFGAMLTSDAWGGFVRVVVLSAALLTVLLTLFSGIPSAENSRPRDPSSAPPSGAVGSTAGRECDDSADFYALLLGGTLGMMLMASASHLLMVFIAVEMASLPGYALAGFLKGKRSGSESALKYVVYGAAASGVMLYGITLLSGTFGSGALRDVSAGIAARGFDLPVLAGLSLALFGLAFKLAAVPFQFWCPDVFEGAAAEVAGFLSVASKAGAIGLAGRVLFSLHGAQSDQWAVPTHVGAAVAVVAMLTVTFGNLAAFGQTNLKRLLAYSTIAHAGYMLMGLSVLTPAGGGAVLYYLAAYVCMNLGAFAVVALVRNATPGPAVLLPPSEGGAGGEPRGTGHQGGGESVDDCRGLAARGPLAAVALVVFLASLLGLPPLAGFAGKFQVFASVYEATKGAPPWLATLWLVALGVGALNTVASAYYYLKVARAALLEGAPAGVPVRVSPLAGAFLLGLVAALVFAGVVWEPLMAECARAASTFQVK